MTGSQTDPVRVHRYEIGAKLISKFGSELLQGTLRFPNGSEMAAKCCHHWERMRRLAEHILRWRSLTLSDAQRLDVGAALQLLHDVSHKTCSGDVPDVHRCDCATASRILELSSLLAAEEAERVALEAA